MQVSRRRVASRSARHGLSHLILLMVSLGVAWPFIWMATSALKTRDEIWRFPPTIWPAVPQWSNFPEAWFAAPFTRYFFNSVYTATAILVLQLIIGCLAAYSFAFIQVPGRDVLFLALLSTLMIPVVVTYLPSYIILARLGWLDSYKGLIIPSGVSTFGIFLFRQGFRQLPRDLLDAGRVDGAGHLRLLLQIVLPLSKPILITFVMFTFIGYYNAYFWPLLITNNPEMRLLTVGLTTFFIEEGAYGIEWPLMMAANTLAILPLLLLFVVAQRWYIQGVAFVGVKG
jgi:multiple sugar transport system permease protein